MPLSGGRGAPPVRFQIAQRAHGFETCVLDRAVKGPPRCSATGAMVRSNIEMLPFAPERAIDCRDRDMAQGTPVQAPDRGFGSQGGKLLPKRGADVARTLPAPCPHIAHMGCRRCPQLQNKHHLGIRGVRKIGIRKNVVPIWSSFVFLSLGGPVCPSLSQSAPVSPRLS